MNDSGFWIFAKMGGLTEREALTTWTPLLIILGLVSMAVTLLLASVMPLRPLAVSSSSPLIRVVVWVLASGRRNWRTRKNCLPKFYNRMAPACRPIGVTRLANGHPPQASPFRRRYTTSCNSYARGRSALGGFKAVCHDDRSSTDVGSEPLA